MKYSLEEANGAAVVTLQGKIAEGDDQVLFELRSAIKDPRVVFDVERVDHINSFGASCWINFLTDLRRKAIFEFRGCSMAFVTFANMVPGMLSGGRVVSFFAPYHCPECRRAHQIEHVSADVAGEAVPPHAACPGCGARLTADVPFDEYIRFLRPAGEIAGVRVLRRKS